MDEVKVEQVDRDALDAIWIASLKLIGAQERDDEPFLQILARHRLASQPVPASSDLVEMASKAGAEFSGFAWPGDYDENQQALIRATNEAILSAIIPIIQADERAKRAGMQDTTAGSYVPAALKAGE